MNTQMIFRGCRTKEEAMARFAEWLDANEAETIRAAAAHGVFEAAWSPTDVANYVTAQRAIFAERRAECLAIAAQALDAAEQHN